MRFNERMNGTQTDAIYSDDTRKKYKLVSIFIKFLKKNKINIADQ